MFLSNAQIENHSFIQCIFLWHSKSSLTFLTPFKWSNAIFSMKKFAFFFDKQLRPCPFCSHGHLLNPTSFISYCATHFPTELRNQILDSWLAQLQRAIKQIFSPNKHQVSLKLISHSVVVPSSSNIKHRAITPSFSHHYNHKCPLFTKIHQPKNQNPHRVRCNIPSLTYENCSTSFTVGTSPSKNKPKKKHNFPVAPSPNLPRSKHPQNSALQAVPRTFLAATASNTKTVIR